MLSENLKTLRKAKGLSQEELAVKLNVVRQTVSKWEQGLSVPDSEMLLVIAAELETSVSVLLGETLVAEETADLKIIAGKLEVLNQQFAKRAENNRRTWRGVFFAIGILAVISLAGFVLEWMQLMFDENAFRESMAIIGGADGPTAMFVTGATLRVGPVVLGLAGLLIAIIGIWKTRRNS